MKFVRSAGPSAGLAMLLGLIGAFVLETREGTAHHDDAAKKPQTARATSATGRAVQQLAEKTHRLTGPVTEDDYPAATVAGNGDVWLA